MKKKKRTTQLPLIGLTIVMILLILFPLFYAISISFQDEFSIYRTKPQFFPNQGKNVMIEVDFSDLKYESNLEDLMLRDATLAIFPTYTQQRKEGITAIEIYGKIDGKTVFHSRAHTSHLTLENDYGVYKRTNPTQKVLLGKERYLKFMDNIGYEFDLNGIDKEYSKETEKEKALVEKVQDNFAEDFELNGNLVKVEVNYSWLQQLEKYVYYFELPKYMFSQWPTVEKYGVFAFAFNTFLTTGWAILCQVFLPAVTAYPLARLMKKRTSDFMTMFFLITMMIPFVSIMVPQLILMQNLGMYDNYWAMLVPWLVPSPFYIILYKAFFERLPNSLFEAARMDGGSEFYIFTKICMPISKPIVSLIAIQAFIAGWSDFFWYYLATKQASLWTLNVAIFNMSGSQAIKQNFLMGISIASVIPIILFTFIFAKQLKEGALGSSVKG
ncbi:carbohydrate ABC transporter permease [Pseudogracilibacillus auburnensis]|uniref:carbohydrate ABC transporter permease n=1 Tax=Pseudogracilibacillus auburnensis TaxID=1494959 RepID=UPI001A974FB2|nr:carbohydrate ABC transporter permease [Pseudogracilibacillus auburnensis]MBO1004764.1 carbohydrate ABC transporter permease [Pseudogracilibacillus auburnensis]